MHSTLFLGAIALTSPLASFQRLPRCKLDTNTGHHTQIEIQSKEQFRALMFQCQPTPEKKYNKARKFYQTCPPTMQDKKKAQSRKPAARLGGSKKTPNQREGKKENGERLPEFLIIFINTGARLEGHTARNSREAASLCVSHGTRIFESPNPSPRSIFPLLGSLPHSIYAF